MQISVTEITVEIISSCSLSCLTEHQLKAYDKIRKGQNRMVKRNSKQEMTENEGYK